MKKTERAMVRSTVVLEEELNGRIQLNETMIMQQQ